MRRRAETQILCTGSAGRQCKVQVVAALVIRDAVGDAISRQQAAVKPGPWPGRRAAGEALSRSSSVLGGHVHGRTFTCPHLGSVYLYLRRSETGLPLPEAPQASPTSTCAPALRAERALVLVGRVLAVLLGLHGAERVPPGDEHGGHDGVAGSTCTIEGARLPRRAGKRLHAKEDWRPAQVSVLTGYAVAIV